MMMSRIDRLKIWILIFCAFFNNCLAADYRYFVAGGVCAAYSHGITTPIDVIKTKMQADPKEFDKGILDAASKIVKQDGPRVLLGGLGPTVIGYGVEGAAKFGIYEILKPLFAKFIEDQSLAFILASIAAGSVAALILCPAESVRIKVVTDENFANESFLSGLVKIIKEDGIFDMFGGFPAMLAKQVPYTMAKQVSFDMIATFLYSRLKQDLKWVVSFIAAAIASILACIFSQPGDMVLTETYKGKTAGTFPEVISRILKRGGVPEFFVGTQARLFHVGGIITQQLVVYDIVKQLLGLPATGSH